MKYLLILLLLFMGLLQYELWFSEGGLQTVFSIKKNIAKQKKINAQLEERNLSLVKKIKALRTGNQAIEAHARTDLGMVKKGEVFYQVVK